MCHRQDAGGARRETTYKASDRDSYSAVLGHPLKNHLECHKMLRILCPLLCLPPSRQRAGGKWWAKQTHLLQSSTRLHASHSYKNYINITNSLSQSLQSDINPCCVRQVINITNRRILFITALVFSAFGTKGRSKSHYTHLTICWMSRNCVNGNVGTVGQAAGRGPRNSIGSATRLASYGLNGK